MTNGVMNGAINRKLLVLLGPVAGLLMFAGAVWIASTLVSREYKEPYRAPAATRRRLSSRGGTGSREGRCGNEGAGKALRGGRVPEVPRRRQPRRHLVRRTAPPAVCGVRPCRSDLCVHRRGDRLQDRRSALRPARVRVHEAALRLVLAHCDLRSVPDVHARHPVSEVHQLPDERVLPHVSPVRAALLRRGLLPLHLLLRLGEVPSPGASCAGTRPEHRRHGDHAHRQRLAHVHDVAARSLGYGGADLRFGRDLQLHVDADQRPSVHREHRFRRIGRCRLRRLQVPPGGNRRGARALRLDGLHRELRRDQRLPPASLRRLLARERDLRLLPDARTHDDGRRLLVALHHPGGPDREPVSRRQLLPVARDGARRGGAAVPEVRQVPACRGRALLHGLGDAPVDDRDGVRDPGDGRIGAPGSRVSSVSCPRRTPR